MPRLRDALHRIGRRFGYELVAQRSVTAFLASRRIDRVIDAGAHRGRFALHLRRMGYSGSILSFEPAREPFARLAALAARDAAWDAFPLALGDRDGTVALNISARHPFNSAKALTALAAHYPGAAVVGVEEVPLRRLDGIEAARAGERLFLKVDTQGFEREVVAGAAGLLDRLHGVQLELPVEHLYADCWTLPQAIEAMADLGFALAQVRPVTMLRDDPASALEFDCLFRRRD